MSLKGLFRNLQFLDMRFFLYKGWYGYQLLYIHEIRSNENHGLKQNVKDTLIHLVWYSQVGLEQFLCFEYDQLAFQWTLLSVISIGNILVMITLLSEWNGQK